MAYCVSQLLTPRVARAELLSTRLAFALPHRIRTGGSFASRYSVEGHERNALSLNIEVRDEARRVLVRAFQGEDNLSKKWEEEIKRRELAASDGGDGGSRGSGRGGGGGGGDGMDQDSGGQNEPWDWEEAGQTFMATFVLFVLYFSITHGPDQVFDIFKVFFIYIWQGFRLRVIPEEYLRGDANPREHEEREGDLLEEGDSGKDLQRSGQWETNESYEDHVPEREESMEDTDLTSFSDYSEKDREEHIALLEAQSRERVMKMIPHRKMEGMEELDES